MLLGQLSTWGGGDVVLPLVLVAAGLAVIWRQLDTDRTLALPGVRWALAGGVVLAAGGVVLLLATTGQLAEARDGFAATLVILTGVVLATAPIWRRLLDSRAEERTARVRSEERAAVAAHLHDSVLQTLALIQRHADEPQAVSRLARSQERELRAWLYDPAVVREGGTWAGLVAGMVAEVEADHALIVDPVVVGDAPVDDALAAPRRGHPRGAGQRRQALRCHGRPTSTPRSRRSGCRCSSATAARASTRRRCPTTGVGCGTRCTAGWPGSGGTAEIRSAPGEGTEVELVLPRTAA